MIFLHLSTGDTKNRSQLGMVSGVGYFFCFANNLVCTVIDMLFTLIYYKRKLFNKLKINEKNIFEYFRI